MPEEETISAVELLTRLYRDMDEEVAKRIEGWGVTCKKGCWACCNLLAVINIADGIYLADYLLSLPNWEEWAQKLRTAALEMCILGINKDVWWKKQKPCVFLAEDKTCQVYERRPAACRYHMVISPPENCYPEAENTKIKMLDLVMAERKTSWDVAEHIAKFPYSAPIPLMTLHCMLLTTENPDIKKRLKEVCADVPDPEKWMRTYAKGWLLSKEVQESARKLKERFGIETLTTPMFPESPKR